MIGRCWTLRATLRRLRRIWTRSFCEDPLEGVLGGLSVEAYINSYVQRERHTRIIEMCQVEKPASQRLAELSVLHLVFGENG